MDTNKLKSKANWRFKQALLKERISNIALKRNDQSFSFVKKVNNYLIEKLTFVVIDSNKTCNFLLLKDRRNHEKLT